jgi:aldose 1-epimerase
MFALKFVFSILIMTMLFSLAITSKEKEKRSAMKKEMFGTTSDGIPVYVYTLQNVHKMQARVTNYGGILVSLLVPDKTGQLDDVVLGYDSLATYEKNNNPYFGALIGRYGNRIGKGKFTLNGKEYTLALNNGPNHLHGGLKGFDKVVWTVSEKESSPERSIVLTYLSKDGEEGYPGNLSVKVVYTLTDNDELKIEYSATTDKPTVLNLTHHSYFNLEGAGRGSILAHELMIDADTFAPVDSTLIPTGELRPVRGTPFDFRKATTIGARISGDNEQLRYGKGYDHNFVLNRKGKGLGLAARVYESTTGRAMDVLTTEPGVQFYSGNFLDGKNIGKGGISYDHRYGFCLETQHFPDSPNKPKFPTTVLKPGEKFSSTTVYKFYVKK